MAQQVVDSEETAVDAGAGVKAEGVKAEGELWDLNRPLEGDCTLALIKFGVRLRVHAHMRMHLSRRLHMAANANATIGSGAPTQMRANARKCAHKRASALPERFILACMSLRVCARVCAVAVLARLILRS
jgi:hypothetical protein